MQGGALPSLIADSTIGPAELLEALQEEAATKVQHVFRTYKADQGLHTSSCRRFRRHGTEYLEDLLNRHRKPGAPQPVCVVVSPPKLIPDHLLVKVKAEGAAVMADIQGTPRQLRGPRGGLHPGC